jgi:hypothetical protein
VAAGAAHAASCTPDFRIKNLANGQYVSVELGYTGAEYAMLRARATSVGPWERFIIQFVQYPEFKMVANANTLYVSAELGYSGSWYGMLRARASTAGPWEKWTV